MAEATPLTTSARRAFAASVIDRGSEVGTGAALLVADVLDATCAGILRSAGCDDDTARAALTAMFGDSDRSGV